MKSTCQYSRAFGVSKLRIRDYKTIYDLDTHSQISPVCKFKMGNLRNKKGSLCADIMETKCYLK